MLRIIDHNSIDPDKWDKFVDNHQNGTIFHSRQLFLAYSNSAVLKPFALFCVSDNGHITGMFLAYYQSVLRGIFEPFSRRIVLMHAPITDDANSLILLLQSLKAKARFSSIYVEIRNHYDLGDYQAVYKKDGYIYEPHLNILVDLSKNEDQLWQDVGVSRKKEIKKAQKEDFEIKVNDHRAKHELYSILREIYTRASS